MQETWLEEGADLSLFQIPGYDCVAKGKYCSAHGGLITYVHNNYSYDICNLSITSNLWEGLLLKVTVNKKPVYVYNIYRPPAYLTNDNMIDLISEINIITSGLNISKSNIFILGDFNIDLLRINDNSVFKDFLDNMFSLGFNPSITLPTRITEATATLIDNIFTNESKIMQSSGIILSDISDHFPYFYMFDTENYMCDTVRRYNYVRKSDETSIKNLIQFLDTVEIMALLYHNPDIDPNMNYNILESLITNALDIYMPLKRIKLHKYKHKKTEWITAGIIRSIKFRDNLYKRMKQALRDTPDYYQLKQNLATYNKILKRTIRNAKTKYYYSKFHKCGSDTRKTWKTINSVLNRSQSNKFPEYININNQNVTNKTTIANSFNNYFSKIGSEMASSIPVQNDIAFSDYLKGNISTKFKFEDVTEMQIKLFIQGLNSKSSFGYDGISLKLLKRLESVLTKPLTLIINQSLKTGIFPNKLKLGKVIPVHKKDDIHQMENYRPISLLPSISKVFEKVVHHQIYLYFSRNNYLCSSQYGFRKHHSTEHAVLEIADRISSELDKGNTPLSIFLDLSKAFDTLNYNILLSKLEFYGIKDVALKWFNSYLSDRLQYVQIEHCSSNVVPVLIGVPQGSILGPFLFTIYINDIQNSTDFFKLIKYADDTTLFNEMTNTGCDSIIINDELNKVYVWLCANRLSLNIKKTKFMLFHNKNKNIQDKVPVIKLHDVEIVRVRDFNFLGITINENLNWSSHINKISTKVSRAIGILCKLKHFFPISTLKILYSSLILSQFTYGILIWGFNVSKLLKLQKKAIRNVSNSKYNSHTDPLFKSLGLLKLEDIYTLNALKFYFQYCQNQLPAYLLQFIFKHRSEIHSYDTRIKDSFDTNKTRTRLADSSIRQVIPRLINDTPHFIIDKIYTHSLQGFTSYIKQYFINSYNINCNILNCYICQNN